MDPSTFKLLKGKKALVTGIANDQSIAWGCAKAFSALGADLAVTYRSEKTKKYVDPLLKEVKPSIYMPMDVQRPGELEAVFEAIDKKWGRLDILLHSIAFAPKEDLQGRVVDCSKEERRHAVHDDVLWLPDGGRKLQPDGAGEGGARSFHPVSRRGAGSQGHQSPCYFAGSVEDTGGLGHQRIR
jgi:hypothetical protein